VTKVIDVQDALDLLATEVEKAGADYVYERPNTGGIRRCLYEYNNQPSCLVGRAWHAAGVPVEDLRAIDKGSGPIGAIEIRRVGPLVITDAAAEVFGAAQNAQDGGFTYGSALKDARRVAELVSDGNPEIDSL
jgi:hypothetical protein